jgi:hypothetical protein
MTADISTTTERDEDDIALDQLLAEFKENHRMKAEKEAEEAKKPVRLEVDIPRLIYNQSAQASAFDGISLDEFVADALEIYLGDDYNPDEEA